MAPQIEPIYFKFQLKLLLLMGIDILPIKNKFVRFIFHLYSVVLMGLTIYIYIVVEALDIFLNFTDLEKMTFGLSYFVTHILGMAKISILIVKRESLWNSMQKLENGVFKPDNKRGGEKEFDLVKSAIRGTDYQGYFFLSFVFIIVGLRGIGSLLDPGKDIETYDEIINTTTLNHVHTMPFTTWFPFDVNVQPYYAIGFIYQIASTIIYGLYIGAADAIICGYFMHIKTQYLILKLSLDTLIERAKRNIANKFKDYPVFDESTQKMQSSVYGLDNVNLLPEKVLIVAENLVYDCVYHHQQLLFLCGEIENEFSYLMLLQFLSSLFLVCFTLFQISLAKPASAEFFSMCCYLLLMMFQLLCYCWHGNEVLLESGNISNYVYHTDWLILNEATKKALLLMMMRAQRPFRFTAGKFSLLSLPTYMNIVRGSTSYFMVLRQMQTK